VLLRLLVAAALLHDAPTELKTDDAMVLPAGREIPPWRLWDSLPDSAFAPMSTIRSRRLFPTRPILVRIPVRAPSPGRWWLVSDVKLARLDAQCGRYHIGSSEAADHFLDRPGPPRELSTPIELSDTARWIHILVSDPRAGASFERMGMKLVSDREFPRWLESRTRFNALVLGFSAAFVMIAAYLWFAVREASLGWYTAYLASYLLWFAFSSGDIRLRILPGSFVFSSMAIGCIGFFLASLLGLRRKMPILSGWLRGMSLLNLLLAVSSTVETVFCAPAIPWIAKGLIQLVALLCIGAVLVRGAIDDPLARRLLVAISPLLAATVVGCLVQLNWCSGSYALRKLAVVLCVQAENVLTTLVLAGELLRRERRRLALEGDFHGKVMEQSDKFRQAVAYDLHDDIGQQAVALRMRLHNLRSRKLSGDVLKDLDGWVERLGSEIRRLSHDLHPPQLSSAGFSAALAGLCADRARLCGIEIAFAADVLPEPAPERAIHLFRIAQQAIANAERHARASRIEVGLERAFGRLRLTVRDDGCGFVPTAATLGIGIEGMRSRAMAMGGTLEIDSSPGKGALVVVEIPDLARRPDGGSRRGFAAVRGRTPR